MNKENKKFIEKLEKKYQDDTEALEEIKRAKTDIEYIEKKENESDYTGQSSKGYLMGLEAFLHDWY